MEKIKTLMIEPGKEPVIHWLPVSISSFNNAVSKGTYYECTAEVKQIEPGVYILYADESVTLMFAPNRRLNDSIINGVFYVIGSKDNFPVSLTNSQIRKYQDKFGVPEEFSEQEALFHNLNTLCKEIDEMHFKEL